MRSQGERPAASSPSEPNAVRRTSANRPRRFGDGLRHGRFRTPGWFLVAAILVATLPAPAREPLVDPAPVVDWLDNEPQPKVLRPPLAERPEPEIELELPSEQHFAWPGAPTGFAGRSGILPRDLQTDEHFVPTEDRWRIGFPEWDRYSRGFPLGEDYQYKPGRWWDPYNQNVLKGDYPIVGQHTFLNVSPTSRTIVVQRQVPTPTSPFESTQNPFQEEFFGDPNQFVFRQYFSLPVELFHGDAGFKPADWRLKVLPIFNLNYLDVNELAVVNPNVLAGTTRFRNYFALEEWFVETKLADLSPNYDFVSVRAGSQPFISDFRGFIFADVNRSVRLFGNRSANREQFNVIFFDQTEKDTNSFLNTFDDRHQNTLIANYFVQDFLWPGYTTQFSYHYNRDGPSTKFDRNDFLVRPDPVGVFAPHKVEANYLGWAGDGHINRVNVSHAFYYAFGHDSLNPLAGRPQTIDAYMAAAELSYDRDWVRFRSSFFWASGDDDPNDRVAQGFDAIFDNPNFAGGEFSYWQRQAIRLFGVNLVNEFSLLPDLRSSKLQGQANFVNPGLLLVNAGVDLDVTPKWKLVQNTNFLWFDDTDSLETFVFQDNIHRAIGTDVSLGVEYRPLLNDNVQIIGGVSGFIPGRGFEDLFSTITGRTSDMYAAFLEVVATY